MNDLPGMTKTPYPLKPSERKWTIALVLIGATLVLGVLAVYLGNTNGVLLSKDGTKEYSDTLVLAVIGAGVLVILCGAFYGRIREITIPGGAGLKLAAPDTLPDAVEKAIEKQAKADHDTTGVDVDDRSAALKEEAHAQAQVLFAQQYWGWPPQPPAETVNDIAQAAVERAMLMRPLAARTKGGDHPATLGD